MTNPPGPPLHRLAVSLEAAEALDAPARMIDGVIHGPVGEGPGRALLGGTWLGHALHPLLTDIPVGAWTSSLILDIFGGSSAQSGADLLIGVGLAAVPATALSGWSDWTDTDPAPRRLGLVHAAANITAAAMFAASLRLRREDRRAAGKLVSGLAAATLGLGGYLGGHLSYARGVGMGDRAA